MTLLDGQRATMALTSQLVSIADPASLSSNLSTLPSTRKAARPLLPKFCFFGAFDYDHTRELILQGVSEGVA
jgi:hypothetical protein